MASTIELKATTTTVKFGGITQEIHTLETIDSLHFLEVFNRYDTDGNGYIDHAELDDFIGDLLKLSVAYGSIEDVKKDLLGEYDYNNDGNISMAELAKIIPVDNYMGLYGLNVSLHIADFMKIWFHYDADKSGDLEVSELKGFLFDLLKSTEIEPTSDKIDTYTKAMLDLHDKDHNSKISLSELLKVLPVENNYLAKYGKWLTSEEFEEVFEHYDRDGNGFIEDNELYGFVKDIVEKNGKEPTAQEIEKYRSVVMEIFDKNYDNRISRPELRMIMLGK